MVRGKVVLKPIDNPSSRKVTFCKRRRGLMKKAHELAVLCDVEVALLLFSTTGKFYHFSSANSIESTIRRYHQHQEAVKPKKVSREAAGNYHKDRADGEQKSESVTPLRLLENIKAQELNIYELTQLEQELYTSLSHIIMWKNQLIADSNSSLQKVASSSTTQMAEKTVSDLPPIDGDALGSPLCSPFPSNS